MSSSGHRAARLFVPLMMLTAAVVLAAACAAPAVPAPAPGPTARTVTDAAGRAVEITGPVERVVALGENELDMVLALDITPVATISARGSQGVATYVADRVPDIAIAGTPADANVEAVAAADPDLVVVGAATSIAQDPTQLDALSAVAPTFVAGTPGEDWTAVLTRVADAVGVPDRVAPLVTADDELLAGTRAALALPAGTTAGVVRWNADGPVYMLSGNSAVGVLGELGFGREAAQDQPGPSHSAPISLEQLPQIDADWMFVGSLNPDGTRALDAARQAPTFATLRAAESGHVVPVDGLLWTTGAAGPIARAAIMENVRAAVAS